MSFPLANLDWKTVALDMSAAGSLLEKLLLQQRACGADWLALQAQRLVALAESERNANLLVFSCLEARNAIEQLWFELLMVIRGGSLKKAEFENIKRRRGARPEIS